MPLLESVVGSKATAGLFGLLAGDYAASHDGSADAGMQSIGREKAFDSLLNSARELAVSTGQRLAWTAAAINTPNITGFLAVPHPVGDESGTHVQPVTIDTHHLKASFLSTSGGAFDARAATDLNLAQVQIPHQEASDFLFTPVNAHGSLAPRGRATSFGIKWYVPIDEADASSVFGASKMTVGGKGAFQPEHALRQGSGYWCSGGGHPKDEVVTWKGIMRSRRPAKGIKISWAYAPGEVQIKTSPDGHTFHTAVAWHSAPRKEVAYEEDMLFDRRRNVKEVEIDMRSPKPWGFFGIHQTALEM